MRMVRWLRSLDVRILLIVTLIIVSTGHVGRLFADREDVRQAFVGYVLALSLDGVLAVSLYEAANVRERSHRVFALVLFVFACAVSGGFNVAYYRQNYPQDPPRISLLLGLTAPILAALVAVLRAFGDVEQADAVLVEQQAEHALELEKHRIEQLERTRREVEIERERTKQERARARAEKARSNIIEQRTERAERAGSNGRLTQDERDELARAILAGQPDIGPRKLSRELGCAPSTASRIIKRLTEEV